MEKYFSGLIILPAGHKTVKRKEREIGQVIESLARDMCCSAVNEEALLQIGYDKEHAESDKTPVQFVASFNA